MDQKTFIILWPSHMNSSQVSINWICCQQTFLNLSLYFLLIAFIKRGLITSHFSKNLISFSKRSWFLKCAFIFRVWFYFEMCFHFQNVFWPMYLKSILISVVSSFASLWYCAVALQLFLWSGWNEIPNGLKQSTDY